MKNLFNIIKKQKHERAIEFTSQMAHITNLNDDQAGQHYASFSTGYLAAAASFVDVLQGLPVTETEKVKLVETFTKSFQMQELEDIHDLMVNLTDFGDKNAQG